MATDKPRYTVSVSDEMFEEIENFRFENRFQTRSDATAELIRLGLESIKKDLSTPEGMERLRRRLEAEFNKQKIESDAQ
jgi:metal-responsive CopG/Arc/MetJ family transcriptional regulator